MLIPSVDIFFVYPIILLYTTLIVHCILFLHYAITPVFFDLVDLESDNELVYIHTLRHPTPYVEPLLLYLPVPYRFSCREDHFYLTGN